VGRVWIGIGSRVEYLRRLAVVFAVPIRLKIVTELYQREMSPKQFFEEFGGGSVSRVAQHFKKLRDNGWLRHIRSEGPGGARRGATETIYRATDLPFCDRETWVVLPYSIRIAVGWNGFKEIAKRLREAMEALTFQARPDSRLTGTRLLLDRAGCGRVAEAVTQEFAAQFEEQEDARRRASHAGEELFRVGSLLTAFELPSRNDPRRRLFLIEDRPPLIPFPVRVSKVFRDEVCLQIVDDANRGEISIPMFYAKYGDRFDLDEGAIRRRFKILVEVGWLKVVGQKSGGRRRGGVEKFYSATGPAFYDEAENSPWASVPDSLRKTDDWKTFAQLSEWAKRAMAAGTFHSRDDTCLAWSILSLDQQGWDNVIASLEKLLAFIVKEQELAQVRMKRSGEEATALVVALGAFETPKPVKEA
jgi:DNA-binding transcriptional ArsR family regulator